MGGCDGMNLYCDIVFESGSVKGILKYPWAMRLEVPEEFNRLARQPALHSGATTALDDGLGSEDMSTTRSCDDLVQEEGVSCPGCLVSESIIHKTSFIFVQCLLLFECNFNRGVETPPLHRTPFETALCFSVRLSNLLMDCIVPTKIVLICPKTDCLSFLLR